MNFHNITHCDQNNGDGLRAVLWLSGCSHHCIGCQNPQTWDPYNGILFDEDAKKELFDELEKDYISGITFSGGDPLYEESLFEVYNLINEIKNKFPSKTIWLYTGYTWEEIKNNAIIYLMTIDRSGRSHIYYENLRKQIVKKCDVVIDGRYEEDKRDITLHWRGSSNQRVIDVQKSLKQDKVILYCD